MKLTRKHNAASRLRKILGTPPGPGRAMELVDLCDESLSGLPSLAVPDPVQVALDAYTAAKADVEKYADAIATAEATDRAAARGALQKAKDALLSGATMPKPPTPGRAADAALVALQGAEAVLQQRHDEVVAAAEDSWAVWRDALAERAAGETKELTDALDRLLLHTESAAMYFAGLSTLDAAVLDHDPALAEKVKAEQRPGRVNWYEACHPGGIHSRPLTTARIPVAGGGRKGLLGGDHGGVRVPIRDVLLALEHEARAAADFAPADWTPPGASDHDELLSTPLTGDEPWLRAFAWRGSRGGKCAVCGAPAVRPALYEGEWWPMCEAHAAASEAAVAEALKEAERAAQPRGDGGDYFVDPSSGAHVPAGSR